MAVGSPPTVRRRQLGRELRRLREESKLLAEHLAARLRCSTSRVSRIETARVRITPGTVHEILDVLGVDGPERDRLVALAREADTPGWWQQYTDTLPYEYSTYIALESEAVSLRVFEPILVYGLLQTEEYARAIVERGAGHRQPVEVEAWVRSRLARQDVLTKPNPVRLHTVLDESVLRRVIGGQEVMRAQRRRLLALAQLPNVTIQVLPFESAGVLARLTGPLVILELPDPGDGPIVYVESHAGDHYLERPADVSGFTSTFERLCAEALDPDDSMNRIELLG